MSPFCAFFYMVSNGFSGDAFFESDESWTTNTRDGCSAFMISKRFNKLSTTRFGLLFLQSIAAFCCFCFSLSLSLYIYIHINIKCIYADTVQDSLTYVFASFALGAHQLALPFGPHSTGWTCLFLSAKVVNQLQGLCCVVFDTVKRTLKEPSSALSGSLNWGNLLRTGRPTEMYWIQLGKAFQLLPTVRKYLNYTETSREYVWLGGIKAVENFCKTQNAEVNFRSGHGHHTGCAGAGGAWFHGHLWTGREPGLGAGPGNLDDCAKHRTVGLDLRPLLCHSFCNVVPRPLQFVNSPNSSLLA